MLRVRRRRRCSVKKTSVTASYMRVYRGGDPRAATDVAKKVLYVNLSPQSIAPALFAPASRTFETLQSIAMQHQPAYSFFSLNVVVFDNVLLAADVYCQGHFSRVLAWSIHQDVARSVFTRWIVFILRIIDAASFSDRTREARFSMLRRLSASARICALGSL